MAYSNITMKNVIKLLEGDIVYNKFFGDQDENSMGELIAENHKLVQELVSQGAQPKFLGDIAEMGKLSSKARKMAVESFSKSTKYQKVAIIGANRFYGYLINLMSKGLAAIGDVRTFSSEKAAMDWLMSR